MSRILFEFFGASAIGTVGFALNSPGFTASGAEAMASTAAFTPALAWSSAGSEAMAGACSFLPHSPSFTSSGAESMRAATFFDLESPSFTGIGAESLQSSVAFPLALAFASLGAEAMAASANFAASPPAFAASGAESLASSSSFAVARPGWSSSGAESMRAACVFDASLMFAVSGLEAIAGTSVFSPRLHFIAFARERLEVDAVDINVQSIARVRLDLDYNAATMIAISMAPTVAIDIARIAGSVVNVSNHQTIELAQIAQATCIIDIEQKEGLMSRTPGDSDIVVAAFGVYDPLTDTRDLTDPARVLVHVKQPDGSEYSVEYGVDPQTTISRIAAGKFWVRVPFTMKGTYRCVWQGVDSHGKSLGTEPFVIQVEELPDTFSGMVAP